ncbi:MAG: 2-hydroxyglutaryl-CoA dehydratase, D-component [Paenibacillaceae bacterium]|jgi:benzoyl-CoA reductase/2-hydroxyglutaryl-CoA dehydratase subunit BcrC/BadD/HgdB|nr:2-hydroxyglutaryl-CoA dehydratase, D-component [Paenibacillaceae bacterium]
MSALWLGNKGNAPADAAGAQSSATAEIKELVKTYNLSYIEKLVAQGQKAIWGGLSWEAPLIYACDTIPVGISELWRDESRAAESVAENYFQIPPEFCSMIKAMIGRLHLRAPDPINKVIYFGSVCEPIASVYELAKSDNYDVFCIENVTAFKTEDKRPEVVSFLVKELERVALWLNDGKPLDEEKLWAEIKRKNLVSQKIRTILDLRVKAPLYLSSVPTMELLLGSTHYFGQPERYIALLDQLIEELTLAAQAPEERFFIPIVLAGGSGGKEILKVIEESHGAIVGWVAVGTEDYRLDVPPLESIAHYLLDSQKQGELGEGAGTSATYRRFRVEELIKQTGAKGIISSAITGCPYGSVVQKTERDYFKGLNVPVITLETNVHKERPSEEQIMRVKTFVEMLT